LPLSTFLTEMSAGTLKPGGASIRMLDASTNTRTCVSCITEQGMEVDHVGAHNTGNARYVSASCNDRKSATNQTQGPRYYRPGAACNNIQDQARYAASLDARLVGRSSSWAKHQNSRSFGRLGCGHSFAQLTQKQAQQQPQQQQQQQQTNKQTNKQTKTRDKNLMPTVRTEQMDPKRRNISRIAT